jgi:mannan endo-1,4-beta-mannosidase
MWAFNSGVPKAKGVYDETQMEAYDYVIATAAKVRASSAVLAPNEMADLSACLLQHGVYLIMALGNTWTAYKPPEDYFWEAGINPTNLTILDWYGHHTSSLPCHTP